MSAGEWRQITAATVPGGASFWTDVDNPSTKITDWMHKMSYDPINRKVRFLGMGHQGRLEQASYTESTDAWTRDGVPPFFNGSIGHGYAHNTIDPLTGDHYFRMYGDRAGENRYTQSTGAWMKTAAENTVTQSGGWGGIEFFPGYGSAGGLIISMGNGIHAWDKATNAWTRLSTYSTSEVNSQWAVLSTFHNVVYCNMGTASSAWFSVDKNGTVTSIGNCPITAGHTGSFAWCCPVTGHLIVAKSSSNAARYIPGQGWSSYTFGPGYSFSLGDSHPNNGGLFANIAPYRVIFHMNPESGAVWLYKYA